MTQRGPSKILIFIDIKYIFIKYWDYIQIITRNEAIKHQFYTEDYTAKQTQSIGLVQQY